MSEELGKKLKVFSMKSDDIMGVLFDARSDESIVKNFQELAEEDPDVTFKRVETLPPYLKKKFYEKFQKRKASYNQYGNSHGRPRAPRQYSESRYDGYSRDREYSYGRDREYGGGRDRGGYSRKSMFRNHDDY